MILSSLLGKVTGAVGGLLGSGKLIALAAAGVALAFAGGLATGELHGRATIKRQWDAANLEAAYQATQASFKDANRRMQESAAIGAQHQKELENVEREADATVAAVRAGTLRVRDNLEAACSARVQSTAAANSARAAAVVYEAGQRRLVSIGGQCDSIIAGLQAQAAADRRK